MPKAKMNRANIFMGASWVGLAGLILIGGAEAPSGSAALRMGGTTLLIIGSFAMLFTRRADEYTERLWNAGASVAFAALLINFIGLAFVEGFIAGLTDREIERSIPGDVALLLSIVAFYIGLFVKRLLGDR